MTGPLAARPGGRPPPRRPPPCLRHQPRCAHVRGCFPLLSHTNTHTTQTNTPTHTSLSPKSPCSHMCRRHHGAVRGAAPLGRRHRLPGLPPHGPPLPQARQGKQGKASKQELLHVPVAPLPCTKNQASKQASLTSLTSSPHPQHTHSPRPRWGTPSQ